MVEGVVRVSRRITSFSDGTEKIWFRTPTPNPKVLVCRQEKEIAMFSGTDIETYMQKGITESRKERERDNKIEERERERDMPNRQENK